MHTVTIHCNCHQHTKSRAHTRTHLDAANGAGGDGTKTDLADVNRVIVTIEASVGVWVVGVLPSARKAPVVELKVAELELTKHALGLGWSFGLGFALARGRGLECG